MGIPTLELHPGVGLGPFTLGSPICDALAEIEQHQSLFESTVIKYNDQDPGNWDIVIAFPHLGFHLCFDPHQQRLYKLEVYDVTRVHLRYANSIIGGPSTAATFSRIYSVLGPTFPGTFKQETATYTLSYPGLSLLFRIPPRYTSCCLKCKELPLEFPDGTTAVVSRVILHLGEHPYSSHDTKGTNPIKGGVLTQPCSKGHDPLSPQPVEQQQQQQTSHSSRQEMVHQMPTLSLPNGGVYMEEVHVRLGQSLFFSFGQQEVSFGDSPQDVWSELGRPCSIVQREMETMLIHRPVSAQGEQLGHLNKNQNQNLNQIGSGYEQEVVQAQGMRAQGDFAWSYFTRGIDIVFDAETRTVKKFVLHTNSPGHPDFNEYVKCNFIIYPETPKSAELGSKKDAVTADSKWDDVQSVMGCGGRGAIQTSGPLHAAFGPTFVHGLRGATFEVMRNGHISTVTLFQT